MLSAGIISGLTWDGGSLWQTRLDENWIQRLNPNSQDIDQTIAVAGYGRIADVTWDGRTMWAISQQEGKLVAFQPESGDAKLTFEAPPASTGLSYHNDSLWLCHASEMTYNPQTDSFDWQSEDHHYYLSQINSVNGKLLSRVELNFLPMGIEWIADQVILSSAATGQLFVGELNS